MKQNYLRLLNIPLIALLILFSSQKTYAQTCPGGGTAGGTAFDTTIAFASGITTTDVKFPKFDPQTGMVTCVRLCITITGVIDSLAMQNFAGSAQSGTFNYVRKDTIRGPGLSTPLTNWVNQSYGPFPLSPYDGVPGAGSDFYSQGHDTILNAQLCRTLTDSATIVQFYGLDSVAYNYTIDVSTAALISGGSSSNLVFTSALVNFHFEYCTCPPLVLPLNINWFDVNKITSNKAELKWTAFEDVYSNYHYEAEYSEDGYNFSTISSFPKHNSNEAYQALYTAASNTNGLYYFRVKQVYSNGYVRYSNIKTISLENSGSLKFSMYPNPSTGIVGIKFDNISDGHFNIQIYNPQGQVVVQKGIVIGGSSYTELGVLKAGTYWVRLVNKQTQESCVNQLIIK